MNSVVTYIDKDRIEMNGQVYKRQRTTDDQYSKAYRKVYMKRWKARRDERAKQVSLL
jgi:phosphate uptake regulator